MYEVNFLTRGNMIGINSIISFGERIQRWECFFNQTQSNVRITTLHGTTGTLNKIMGIVVLALSCIGMLFLLYYTKKNKKSTKIKEKKIEIKKVEQTKTELKTTEVKHKTPSLSPSPIPRTIPTNKSLSISIRNNFSTDQNAANSDEKEPETPSPTPTDREAIQPTQSDPLQSESEVKYSPTPQSNQFPNTDVAVSQVIPTSPLSSSGSISFHTPSEEDYTVV